MVQPDLSQMLAYFGMKKCPFSKVKHLEQFWKILVSSVGISLNLKQLGFSRFSETFLLKIELLWTKFQLFHVLPCPKFPFSINLDFNKLDFKGFKNVQLFLKKYFNSCFC